MHTNGAPSSAHGDSTGFSDRLKKLRLRLGHTKIADFGAATGLDPGMLRKWEEGVATPTIEQLNALARPIHRLGIVDWDRVATWLVQPGCDSPAWLREPSHVERPIATQAATCRLPWHAIRELANSAIEATNPTEIDDIARELLEIVLVRVELRTYRPDVPTRTVRRANGSAKSAKPVERGKE